MDTIDSVDYALASLDGKINRQRDPLRCRHNVRQKCTNCLPLDPYDENYLMEKDIKHMSFHSFVRKSIAGHGKGTQLNKPLETMTCKLRLNCTSHKPYPDGICSSCRPPTISLNRQVFRFVDNISIENEYIIDRFLQFWRKSGNQRVGYLIGRYETFLEVPLGIKATVAAIYEPPQVSSGDSVRFLDDCYADHLDKLCSYLDLRRVGWVFTDLWSGENGKVKCTRHKDSYLLSAEECITAGWLQNKFRNRTQYSSDNYFGSKFVTLVASGDDFETVHLNGYQVSNQCMALVDADLLCPTSHPELACIRENPINPRQFIPDVQYMEKNEYGVETRRNGRPLPVEYLLVDVPAGMPKQFHATFYQPPNNDFPIENRSSINELQDSKAVKNYMQQFSTNQFLDMVTNFHFLFFLITNTSPCFDEMEIKELCHIVQKQDSAQAETWASKTENWTAFVNAHANTDTSEHGISTGSEWSCMHCTFSNVTTVDECAMCGLPKHNPAV